MTAFNAKLNVIAVTASAPTKEALEKGASPRIELTMTVGIMLPFENPATGQPLVVPLGDFTNPIDKRAALNLAKTITEAAEDLPEVGQVMPAKAGDLKTAEEIADRLAQMKDSPSR